MVFSHSDLRELPLSLPKLPYFKFRRAFDNSKIKFSLNLLILALKSMILILHTPLYPPGKNLSSFYSSAGMFRSESLDLTNC